jgi:hypothetical protein
MWCGTVMFGVRPTTLCLSIANVSIGRNEPGSPALMYFSVDSRPSRAVRSHCTLTSAVCKPLRLTPCHGIALLLVSWLI